MSRQKQKKQPAEPKEFELYQNPNDRMHPWNYREFLRVTGQLPKPKPGHSDGEMYDVMTEFEAKKPAKKR
ncbi:MAG: hypothetical protein FJY77_06300 [Candidatus Altiarchaeales archaeon]|nr:hypothetical protein [Candidatus Altiarchaeales archaeon]